MIRVILTVILFSALVGCTTAPKTTKSPNTQIEGGLVFEPVEGSYEVQNYVSQTETKKFQEGALVNKKMETVRFDVHTAVRKLSSDKSQIFVEMTTRNKDGEVDLHALAFPEEGETLKFVFDKHYEVLLADRFPKTSLFFVPPVFLPRKTVKVGDTWSNTKNWLGLYNNLPLRLDVTSILKSLRVCPGGEECAEIEVSGRVSITGELRQNTKFDSLLQGRFLIGTLSSQIYWSGISSREILTTSLDRVEIKSCLESNLIYPKRNAMVKAGKKVSCDFSKNIAPVVP